MGGFAVDKRPVFAYSETLMTFNDEEFGEIIVRKSAISRALKFSVAPNGKLRISVPKWVSDRNVKHALEDSRDEIRSKLHISQESDMKKRQRIDKIEVLRSRAKQVLPVRLAELARIGDFSYEKVRFSHSSSRWGSCSSNGTISLNIALMKLPPVLIDYVLIHELSHTRHMNHSPAFWSEVAKYDKNYQKHRKTIKMYSPTVD